MYILLKSKFFIIIVNKVLFKKLLLLILLLVLLLLSLLLPYADKICRCSRKKPMGLIVALGDEGEASGQLFWDDGESIGQFLTGIILS